jgi:hypothetical protein
MMRKVISIAAAPGFLAGVYLMGASFFGFTMDKLGVKAIFVLHLGIFPFVILLSIVDPWSKGVDVWRGKPPWVVRSMQTLLVLFIAFFFVSLAVSHAASPDIIGGEYVLTRYGKIVAHISERDYLYFKGWQLRFFASLWIYLYYTLMMLWWFPRQYEWLVVMPDKRNLGI